MNKRISVHRTLSCQYRRYKYGSTYTVFVAKFGVRMRQQFNIKLHLMVSAGRVICHSQIVSMGKVWGKRTSSNFCCNKERFGNWYPTCTNFFRLVDTSFETWNRGIFLCFYLSLRSSLKKFVNQIWARKTHGNIYYMYV